MKKIIGRSVLAFIATSWLAGCVATMPRQTTFNEAEFARYRDPGTSTVVGQAFLKTVGGEVRYGAGNTVVMVPVTSYTTETQSAVVKGQKIEPTHDPKYALYRRTTIADGNGNFEFHNVPSGSYYLDCPIFWQVPSGYIMVQTGGVAYGHVDVGRGQTSKVVLTR